jgi:hypothetical protein
MELPRATRLEQKSNQSDWTEEEEGFSEGPRHCEYRDDRESFLFLEVPFLRNCGTCDADDLSCQMLVELDGWFDVPARRPSDSYHSRSQSWSGPRLKKLPGNDSANDGSSGKSTLSSMDSLVANPVSLRRYLKATRDVGIKKDVAICLGEPSESRAPLPRAPASRPTRPPLHGRSRRFNLAAKTHPAVAPATAAKDLLVLEPQRTEQQDNASDVSTEHTSSCSRIVTDESLFSTVASLSRVSSPAP